MEGLTPSYPSTGDICNGHELAYAGGRLYFAGSDPLHGIEPWISDGTAAGTRMLADIVPGPVSSRPRNPTPVGGTIFFSADDVVHGRELWAMEAETDPPRRRRAR